MVLKHFKDKARNGLVENTDDMSSLISTHPSKTKINGNPLSLKTKRKSPERYHSWEQRYSQLQAYKRKHGHCNVPNGSGPLYPWINNQRHAFQMYLKDEKTSMTPERLRRLKALGLEMYPCIQKWNKKFLELKTYHDEFGHCEVSRYRDEESKELYSWIVFQRKAYKKAINSNFKLGMSQERIKLLRSIGFRFQS
jgi:hypothetical protein